MQYAAFILDLDGVVYVGSDAVPHAIDALNSAVDRGVRLTAATNNASRVPADVAGHLIGLGLRIAERDVFTSAQAAAVHLRELLPGDAEVLAVGGPGVARALESVGLTALRSDADLAAASAAAQRAQAVVTGYGATVCWHDLAAAQWVIARGVPWIATNLDSTFPTKYGLAPGNGALVQSLVHATGAEPIVVGKPQPALFEAIIDGIGTRDVLVIGDRFDTDIDAAAACSVDALFVLTGVHGLTELTVQPLERWPQFVGRDLRSLNGIRATIDLRDGEVVADLEHPFVLAVVQAAKARMVNAAAPPADLEGVEVAPLVDLRPFLAAAGSVGP